jgi:DNA-binding CsgD family transcriptional regulator
MSTSDLLLLVIVVPTLLLVLGGLALLIFLQLRPRPESSRHQASTPFHFQEPVRDLRLEPVKENQRRWDSLTLRQREIALLVAEGKQNGEIAQLLHLSASTVATHRRSIYKTLGIHSQRELANLLRDLVK